MTVQSVPAPIEGKIESFHAEPGDEVYEGQLLAQVRSAALDTVEERAALDAESARTRLGNLEAALSTARLEAARADADAGRARSEHDAASKIWQRQKLLLSEGATPRLAAEKAAREFEGTKRDAEALATLASIAQSRVEALRSDLEAARKALDDKTQELEQARADVATGDVHSPVNGVIVGRRGQPGEEVNRAMTDLFQIATDMSRLEVVLEPPPPALARFRTGQPATVTVAESATALAGQVKAIDSGKVTIEFANPDPAVKAGLTAHVRIVF